MASSQALTSVVGMAAASFPTNTRISQRPVASSRPIASLPLKSSTSLPQSRTFFSPGAAHLAAHVACRGAASFVSERNFGGSVRCEAAVAEAEAPAVEKFEYQAEVSRLLDLIVHSLYSNKEVFLRELVSNASDALDKMRFVSVTEPELMKEGVELEIRIKTDREKGTITIIDSGIGMTRQELVDSLGTIAQSGTAKFMQAIKDKQDSAAIQDSNLIGQFGVGFYSAFLVADKITVSTRSARSDKQFVWEAEADSSSYVIKEETVEDNLLTRGTSITLHLKEDAKSEYLEASRISSLVQNYSQFISFPIYTWQELSRSKTVEYEEPGKEGEEAVKKTKTEQEKYWDWQLANETKPIWMRAPKEVEKSEYDSFYKSTFKGEFMDPMAVAHFNTEGEIEFRSLLYIPAMPPFGSEGNNLLEKSRNIRLYVKRVFISDEFDNELFPRYLNFIKGVVDSNDLPLNVSREILQESRVVRIMRKRLVRKTFDMIDEIAGREDKTDYESFWSNFGRSLKYGCLEDTASHSRLAPLLRFFSNKSEKEMTTLEEYVGRMKVGQENIYYLAAESIASAKSAPFLEQLAKKDFEVLFLTEAIDEPMVGQLRTFKEKTFVDVTKEDLDLGKEEEGEEDKDKEVGKEHEKLCDWIKQQLGEQVSKVQVSRRLASSPCVLVAGKFGWSANMEKIMRAQMRDSSEMEYMRARRILEINPNHPIIKDLFVQSRDEPNSPVAKRMVTLLHQTALMASGFTPDNPAEFGKSVYEMMALAIANQQQGKPQGAKGEEAVAAAAAVGGEEVVEASEIVEEADPWKK